MKHGNHTQSPSARSSTAFILKSPVTGVLMSLETVPDPVFAQKLVGIGVAIDPTSQEIVAPCDGKISQLHPSHHAIAITNPEGTEVLIHIGLDTVKLRGEGFQPLVLLGRSIKVGEVLIRFNADQIAQKAKSLLTEIVLTNAEKIEDLRILPTTGFVRAGEPLLSFRLRGQATDTELKPTAMATTAKSEPVTVVNPSGLHARPSAVLSHLSKQFESDLLIIKGYRTANLRSIVSILGLEVAKGEKVQIQGIGPDARKAVDAIVAAIQGGLGEAQNWVTGSNAQQSAPQSKTTKDDPASFTHSANSSNSKMPSKFSGVIASPGLTSGVVFQLKSGDIQVEETGGTPAHEEERLEIALRDAKIQLETLVGKLQKSASPDKALIFTAHQELLEDPSLMEIARQEIAQRKSAPYAWKAAYTQSAAHLASLNNPMLAARAGDVRDVGSRVLRLLQTPKTNAQDAVSDAKSTIHYPERCILIAEDLTPSDVATLDRNRVLGLITTTGGAVSHVAILARALDLPALAGLDPRVLELPNGTPVLLDAQAGELRLNPSAQDLKALETSQGAREVQKREERAHALEDAVTLDSRRIEIVANLKAVNEAQGAIELGAEGVGLLRTEFLFMNRETAPTEDEQLEAYRALAQGFSGLKAKLADKPAPLIIRTLDVGGDKPLKYLPIPHEENPFLGERGLRVSLGRPEMFREQLRAILRTAQHCRGEVDVRIMFPMVSTLDELRRAKALLEEEQTRLGAPAIQTGIMVEVPSVALMADRFARESDFFSIGSNDLTQYTLAVDRGHPKLASQVDGLDPSILRLIDMSVKAAHAHGKWVGVCGGIASDHQAVPILLGLGVDELSVSIPAIPAIKAQIRKLKITECQKLAQRALAAGSASEIRGWVTL
jgi:phosphocarrier protein FPr